MRKILASAAVVLGLSGFLLAGVPAEALVANSSHSGVSKQALSPAAYNSSKAKICQGVGLAGGNCSNKGGALNSVARGFLQILSAVAGVIAIVMVVISGIKYTTSAGDAQKVSSAKSSLIYALVGLIVVMLAQVIVHFVIGKVK